MRKLTEGEAQEVIANGANYFSPFENVVNPGTRPELIDLDSGFYFFETNEIGGREYQEKMSELKKETNYWSFAVGTL